MTGIEDISPNWKKYEDGKYHHVVQYDGKTYVDGVMVKDIGRDSTKRNWSFTTIIFATMVLVIGAVMFVWAVCEVLSPWWK